MEVFVVLFFAFVNSASNFGVAPRLSVGKVKFLPSERKCSLNRKNGVALVEGKIHSFLGPQDNLFSTITYGCSS